MPTLVDKGLLTLALAQRIAYPHYRSFYGIINSIDALLSVGISQDVVRRLAGDLQVLASREGQANFDVTRDALILTWTKLGLYEDARRSWLNNCSLRLTSDDSGRFRGMYNRDRLSLWMSIIWENRDLCPPQLELAAATRLKQIRYWQTHLRTCSHDVVHQANWGLSNRARKMAERILAARTPRGFWGNGDLGLTLRVAVNLLSSGVVSIEELNTTTSWIEKRIENPLGLDIRNLALVIQFARLLHPESELPLSQINRLVENAAIPQCGIRFGMCPHFPSSISVDSAFYITSFESSYDEIRSTVSNVLENLGIKPITTESPSLSQIPELPCRWCAGIGQAMLVVADLSAMHRPNIPFELGFAIGQGKQIVLLYNPNYAMERGYASFMSDIPHLFRIEYTNTDNLRERLGRELRRRFDT